MNFPKTKQRYKNGEGGRISKHATIGLEKDTNCSEEKAAMELMGKLTLLVLAAYAAVVQSLGYAVGSNGVVDIHTLMAGMRVLQTVSVSEIRLGPYSPW